jgi:hypothetical protein
MVVGLDEDAVRVDFAAHEAVGIGYAALAVDSTTTPSGIIQVYNPNGVGGNTVPIHVMLMRTVGIGYHYIQALEKCGTGTCSYWGVSSGDIQLGLEGEVTN